MGCNLHDTLVRLLRFENRHARLAARALRVLQQLPPVRGASIEVGFRRDLTPLGPIHAGAFLRQRRMLFETSLSRDLAEFDRIFVHEMFHFVWLRLGNPRRRSYERLLAGELAAHARGELGWSAERRKDGLTPRDRSRRTRRWREYVCESFCDSAAWLFCGKRHPEFTLPARFRAARRAWFAESGVTDGIAV
jgi:hypothetical protein